MKDFYVDAGEEIPPNVPKPRGKPIQVNCFVSYDHAADRTNRLSQTGFILYYNWAPIIWYSKRQNTVEISTFRAEFVALRTTTDLIISLRYKLRMVGLPIEGAAIFCVKMYLYTGMPHLLNPNSRKSTKLSVFIERGNAWLPT